MSDLIGTLAQRPDRPGRWAVYASDGTLLCTFAADDTRDSIRAKLAAGGLMLDDETNQVFKGK